MLALDKDWIPLPKAAMAAGLSPRDMNRVIDEHLIPATLVKNSPTRAISLTGCAMARFYFRSASMLTKEERLAAIGQAVDVTSKTGRAAKVVSRGFVSIDFTEFFKETKEALASMQKSENLVESDPDILGGEPVFRGTRTPIYMVAAAARESSTEELLRAFPAIKKDWVEFAKAYAKANPRRGRKPSASAKKLEVLSSKRVSLPD
jgi:uncharacterized protein (DUF433 family)